MVLLMFSISSSLSPFSQRWYHDGTVKCFSGGHIGLTFLALLVIIYSIVTILFTFLASLDKSEKVCYV